MNHGHHMNENQSKTIVNYANELLRVLEAQTIAQNGVDVLPSAALLIVTKGLILRMIPHQQHQEPKASLQAIVDNIDKLIKADDLEFHMPAGEIPHVN